MQVKISKQAEKFYLSQDSVTRQRLKRGLAGLEHEPPVGDIVSVQGIHDTFRLRVGNFRILFKKESDSIAVTKIHNRGQAYK